MLEVCLYNSRNILKQLERGAFQTEGKYVQEGNLVVCILLERNDDFSRAVSEKVRSVIRTMFRQGNLDAISSVILEKPLLSIYGPKDGQWIITSNQSDVKSMNMTHIHVSTCYSTRPTKLMRLLVVYPDTYVDICVVFVPFE